MARPVDLDEQFWGLAPTCLLPAAGAIATPLEVTRMIFDVLVRLEPDPHQRDLARGWAAELADPAWMLGRQWQMGEHQGEDASSPVAVEISSRATPIGALSPGSPDSTRRRSRPRRSSNPSPATGGHPAAGSGSAAPSPPRPKRTG